MEKLNLSDLLYTDLEKYANTNECPKSLTITEDNSFRHYEFGAYYGLVVSGYLNGENINISSIMWEEDEDESDWFVCEEDGFGLPTLPIEYYFFNKEVFQRIDNWIKEHIFIDLKDCSQSPEVKIIKPIEYEEVLFTKTELETIDNYMSMIFK